MKSLENYSLRNDEGYHYKSAVCSVACAIGNEFESYDINSRIIELTQSYFNQWKIVINTYSKLDSKFQELNTKSDQNLTQDPFSEYDIHALELETYFSDYTYVLIISMKTLLDIMACIIDITVNRKDRSEYSLPDFFSISDPKKKYVDGEIREKLKSLSSNPEILKIKEIRNKLIHRGYSLKTSIAFSKTNQLVLTVYKGVDFYTCENFNVGDSFESFISNLNNIESQISEVLIHNIKELNHTLSYEVSFTFDGGHNSYNYKEI